MGLKNKVFGTLAAATLTLSMFGSVAADDSAHGTVLLGPGTCQVSIAEANANFGTWTYDGVTNKYASNSSNTTSNFNLTVIEHKPLGTCPVSLQFSGLTFGGANIGPTHFQGTIASFSGTLPSGNLGPVPLPGGDYAASLTLVTVPDSYQPGTYEGDIIVKVGFGS